MHRRTVLRLFCASGLTAPMVMQAQDKFPSRPITFVVPFAAGGGGDVIARLLAKGLSERTQASVVVENRTGAGGNIGAAYVMKSSPNGYTLLNLSTTYAIQAAVGKPPFDPIVDMQPILVVSRDPALLVVHADAPWRNAADLVRASREAPGKLTYGSAGSGSIAHLGAEELAFVLGVQWTHVPYKGSSQAFNDVIGKSLDMMLTSATFAAPFIRSGRVRAIGISGRERVSTLPEVPTFAEQGFAQYQVYDWKAMAGPKGMPSDVVALLNRELNEVLRQKSIAEKFAAEGTAAVGGTPEDMMQFMHAEIARWRRVAEAAKVKLE